MVDGILPGTECYESMDLPVVPISTIPKIVIDMDNASIKDSSNDRYPERALFEVFLRILCKKCHLEPGIVFTKDVLRTILKQYGEAWPDGNCR